MNLGFDYGFSTLESGKTDINCCKGIVKFIRFGICSNRDKVLLKSYYTSELPYKRTHSLGPGNTEIKLCGILD